MAAVLMNRKSMDIEKDPEGSQGGIHTSHGERPGRPSLEALRRNQLCPQQGLDLLLVSKTVRQSISVSPAA